MAEVLPGTKRYVFGFLRTGQRASSVRGSVPFDIGKVGAVSTVWAKARPEGWPGQGGEVIRPS